MASLIPALSDKAKLEILKGCVSERNLGYTDEIDINVERGMECSIQAFQDLFDLKKYPITWEMLLEYVSNRHSDLEYLRVNGDYFTIYDHHSDGEPYSQYYKRYNTTISTMLWIIADKIGISEMRIIGDIHGWWEKPQTY